MPEPLPTRRSFFRLAFAAALLTGVAVAPSYSAEPRGGAASFAGELLVATDEMPDPRFARMVIFMVRHDATGAQGFVVNQPLREIPLAVLLEKIGIDQKDAQGSVRLHAGGPVDALSLFVLHTSDYANDGTLLVKGGIALTWNADVLQSLVGEKRPRRSLLALGYAGWAAGQLEKEMKAGGWVRAAADEGLVFDSDYQSKWDRAMTRRRIDL
jgi:putative transcriptional regulator